VIGCYAPTVVDETAGFRSASKEAAVCYAPTQASVKLLLVHNSEGTS
jgi:hypothetical protein